MAKVTLDVETFKALASPTRLDVLRALDERRKTLSELAKELELNKATIHEHLQLLVACELVKKRDDEGRKWIYYELTWQGERLLHPQETTTFAVLLGLSVAAAGGGLAVLGRALDWWWAEKQMLSEPDAFADGPMAENAPPDDQRQASADAGAEPQGGQADQSPEPENQAAFYNETAESGAGTDDGAAVASDGSTFFDEDGILSILLLLTSILLAGFATVVRKKR